MFIESWLTGKERILPFSDYCGPLFNLIPNRLRSSKRFVIHMYKRKTIDILNLDQHFLNSHRTECFRIDYRHVLKLDKRESELLISFFDNTRRNIKKAAKSNLELKIQNDHSGVRLFYEMHCETRKNMSYLLNYFIFLIISFKDVIERTMGDILFAEKDGKLIAGAIYFKVWEKITL